MSCSVFTYGTLMFPEVWHAVTGEDGEAVEATSAGYAIFRVQDQLYPGMVPTHGPSIVSGTVYRAVSQASLERLDRFEGDLYERRLVEVTLADNSHLGCFAYLVAPAQQHRLTTEAWTKEWFIAQRGLARFTGEYRGFARIRDHH